MKSLKPCDGKVYEDDDAYDILESLGKSNNMDCQSIYQDLRHPVMFGGYRLEIRGNGSWFDTLYFSFPSHKKYLFVALAYSWKADEIHWVHVSTNEIIKKVELLDNKPKNSKLRLWWD